MATNVDKYLEPSEISGAAAVVPVGGIILWQNPNAAAANPPPPTGFEYCDGTAVATAGPMFGQTKPNLMVSSGGGTQGMTRGADVTVSYGDGTALVVGGNDIHSHGFTSNSAGGHFHSVDGHTHSIPSDGGHTHTLPVGSGEITFNPGMPVGRLATTNNAGTHSHTGNTGSSAPGTNSVSSHSHGGTTNNASTLPRYVELAYIIRVIV